MFIQDTLGSFEQPMIDSKTFELIFKAFDTDGSGAITRDEMLPFVKASLEAAQDELDEDYDDEEEEEYDPEEQEEDIKQIIDDEQESQVSESELLLREAKAVHQAQKEMQKREQPPVLTKQDSQKKMKAEKLAQEARLAQEAAIREAKEAKDQAELA